MIDDGSEMNIYCTMLIEGMIREVLMHINDFDDLETGPRLCFMFTYNVKMIA